MKPAKPRFLVKTLHQGIAVGYNDTIFSHGLFFEPCCDASLASTSVWHMLYVDYAVFFSQHYLMRNTDNLCSYTVGLLLLFPQHTVTYDAQFADTSKSDMHSTFKQICDFVRYDRACSTNNLFT